MVSRVTVTGDFSETEDCSSGPIAVSQSCAVQVRFLPSAVGGPDGGCSLSMAMCPGGRVRLRCRGRAHRGLRWCLLR